MLTAHDCRFRGKRIARRTIGDSAPIEMFACEKFASCVDTKESGDLLEIAACEGCTSIEVLRSADWITCEHRGQSVGVLSCQCNIDKNIYECPIKGKCVKKLSTTRNRESFGDELDGVIICRDECDVWKGKPPNNGFMQTDEEIPEPKSTKLIITIAAGPDFGKILDLTRPFMEAYAAKCGADFVALTNVTQTWGMYEKFRLKQWAEGYDRTLFLDVDCIVKDSCPDLFEIVPRGMVGIHDDTKLNRDTHWLKRAWGCIMRSQDIARPLDEPAVTLNSGVVLCDRETAMIWSPPLKPLPVEMHEAEQVFVQSTIQDRAVDVFRIDRKFNEQWYTQHREPGNSPDKWRQMAEDAHIVHFASCPNRLSEIEAWLK